MQKKLLVNHIKDYYYVSLYNNLTMIAECINEFDAPDTLEKYKQAGKIADKAMKEVTSKIVAGASVYELCVLGDNYMRAELDKIYRKKKLEYGKGIAFPTSFGINNIAGYYCPSEEEEVKLEKGDVVKIELGIHIDGLPSVTAKTVLIEDEEDEELDTKREMMATLDKIITKITPLFKDGESNFNIVKQIKKYTDKDAFELLTVPCIESHAPGLVTFQMSRNVLDGFNDDNPDNIHKFIMAKHREEYGFTLAENSIDENEVYAVDIALSSGKGLLKASEQKINIYKRNHSIYHSVRLQASKSALKEFQKNKFAMSTKDFDHSIKVRLGMKECMNHHLIEPYPIHCEQSDEFIVRNMFTVIVKKKPILCTSNKL
jgi:methionine aminopeptidase